MGKEPFFDLKSAREGLAWLKPRLIQLEEYGFKGRNAMAEYDLDAADHYTIKIQETMDNIQKRGIIMRDLSEGFLVDFPAVINNIPAYLCWMDSEDDLIYWHYADEGFAGRRRITGEEEILSYL